MSFENSIQPIFLETDEVAIPIADRVPRAQIGKGSRRALHLKIAIVALFFMLNLGVRTFFRKQSIQAKFLQIPIKISQDEKYEFTKLSSYNDWERHFREDEDKKYKASAEQRKGRKAAPLPTAKVILRSEKISVPLGAELEAELVSAANPGLIKARLITGKIAESGESLFEPGSIVFGHGSPNDDRLVISFSKLVTPYGNAMDIEATALDVDSREVGLKGSWFRGPGARFAAGFGLNFLGAASATLQTKTGQQGVVVTDPTISNALLAGASKTATDSANDLLSNAKSNPKVSVSAGKRFILLFTN